MTTIERRAKITHEVGIDDFSEYDTGKVGTNIVINANEKIADLYSIRNNSATTTSGGQGYAGWYNLLECGGRGGIVMFKCQWRPQDAPSAAINLIAVGGSRGIGRDTDGKIYVGRDTPTPANCTKGATVPVVDQVYKLECWIYFSGDGKEVMYECYLDGVLEAQNISAVASATTMGGTGLVFVSATKTIWGEVLDDIEHFSIPTWN